MSAAPGPSSPSAATASDTPLKAAAAIPADVTATAPIDTRPPLTDPIHCMASSAPATPIAMVTGVGIAFSFSLTWVSFAKMSLVSRSNFLPRIWASRARTFACAAPVSTSIDTFSDASARNLACATEMSASTLTFRSPVALVSSAPRTFRSRSAAAVSASTLNDLAFRRASCESIARSCCCAFAVSASTWMLPPAASIFRSRSATSRPTSDSALLALSIAETSKLIDLPTLGRLPSHPGQRLRQAHQVSEGEVIGLPRPDAHHGGQVDQVVVPDPPEVGIGRQPRRACRYAGGGVSSGSPSLVGDNGTSPTSGSGSPSGSAATAAVAAAA